MSDDGRAITFSHALSAEPLGQCVRKWCIRFDDDNFYGCVGIHSTGRTSSIGCFDLSRNGFIGVQKNTSFPLPCGQYVEPFLTAGSMVTFEVDIESETISVEINNKIYRNICTGIGDIGEWHAYVRTNGRATLV